MARRRHGMLLVAIASVAIVAGASAGVARAALTSTRSVAQQPLGTLSLAAPASLTATTSDSCATVALSWPASAGATAYRLEVRTGAGAWGPLTTTSSTSYTDSTGRQGTTATWRVTARHASSGWESPDVTTSATITCGVQSVTDLAVANPCSSTTLTWTAPSGATSFDVQRRVNAGAWTPLATDQSTVGYADATVHPAGAVVEYQVRSGVGTTTNGQWTSSAAIASWQPFVVRTVALANSGTLGTLNVGDTVTVTFSKPVTTSTVASSVVVDNGGGNRGLYLGTTASGTPGIGRLTTVATMFGATTAYAGTSTWSNANATWTWTSTVNGTTMASPLSAEAWTAGTGVRCAADASTLQSTAPTTGGRW